MKFRKKHVVEATQLRQGEPWPVGVEYHERCDDPLAGCSLDGKMFVRTLEGPLVAQYGDWILTDIKGERWPVKDEIFRETYEAVEEADASGSRVGAVAR